MWEYPDAIEEINRLKPLLHDCDYFAGLCGGVLHAGISRHDLDIVLVSITGCDTIGPLLEALQGPGELTYVKQWLYSPSVNVYAFDNAQGKRIDFFVCMCQPNGYTLMDSIGRWIRRGFRFVRKMGQ